MLEENNEMRLSQAEYDLVLQEYSKSQMIENFTGPSVSLISHLVLLILGFVFIVTTTKVKPPDVLVQKVVIEEVVLDKEIEIEIEEIAVEVTEDIITEPIECMPTEVGIETSPVDVSDEAPETDDNADMKTVLDTVNRKSVLTFTGLTGGRNNAGRKNGIGKYGNGPSTRRGQERLNRALRWLASVQNANGSWGEGRGFSEDSGHPAHTGLALLVFLAHGDTPLSEQYGMTVQKAMRWLATYGNQSDLNVKRKPMGYAHGIATYAISEAYAMTKIPFMQTAMENCIDKIIEGQMGNGGFGYAYTSGPRWDMSVAGWNFQALKAARMAGCTHEQLPTAIYKSLKFCKNVAYNGKGAFGYAAKGGKSSSKPNMGGIGVVALQLLGEPNASQVREGCELIGEKRLVELEKVMNNPSKWASIGSKSLYGWYYDTQAIFNTQNIDKARWKRWRKAFETVLINSQHAEGYWQTSGHGTGASTSGRVLSTCWSALQLEVYYRYLPTFDSTKVAKFSNVDAIDNVGIDGEVVIEID